MTRTEGLTLVANFSGLSEFLTFWLRVLEPALESVPAASAIVLFSEDSGRNCGGILAFICDMDTWSLGIQGFNPILIAGFFVAAFVGPAAMTVFSTQGGGRDK